MGELKAPDKPYDISKWAVWEAYEKVRANKGFTIPNARHHNRFAIASFRFEESDLEYIGTHRRDLQFDRARCAIADGSRSHEQCP